MNNSYEQRAQKIRQGRNQAIQSQLPSLKQSYQKIQKNKVEHILNATATELAEMLNNGSTTSVQILHVFCFRAATIGKELEGITEDNFQEALQLAEECDKLRKEKCWKNGTVGSQGEEEFSPLFGIPFSVKDSINMKGFSSSFAAVERYDIKEEEDGEIIRVLKQAGMIPFVRSNLPQVCLTYESKNIIWGESVNPWNKTRTPGGSSGGEGTLLSSRCSPIGIGTDVGGSVRIPALYCGLYSIKPCFQRMLFLGHVKMSPSISGQINVKYNIGPMSRGTEDLAGFMKIMCDEKYFPKGCKDPHKKLIPFDSKLYNKVSQNDLKLRIGYYTELQIYPASPATKRTVQEVVKLLESKGHTLIPIKIPCVEEVIKVIINVLVAEGGFRGFKEMLKGEPLASYYQGIDQLLKYPRATTWILSKTIQKTNPRMSMILSCVRALSAYQYLQLSTKQQQLQKLYFDMWLKQDLDLMIAPGFACQAHKLGFVDHFGLLPAAYTMIFNVFDVPVGCVPVSVVKEDEEEYKSPFTDVWHNLTKQCQKGTTGLPVGIQVVGMPYDEQKVLGMMRFLETEIKFKEQYPYPI